jgi:cystathionine beta-lyase
MIFSIGVVASISSIVRSMTKIGDNVLISSPVYNIFYNSIINNKRTILSSDLLYENGNYHLDFTDLENKMKDEKTTLMILCNPHNPIGKIWTKEELAKIGHLANKYHVLILSDEIHCDIIDPTFEYVPFLSVNDECANNSITTIAPSKCFNIAGLQSSMIVCKNDEVRKKVERGLNTDECAEGNVFSIDPLIKAFDESEDWLNELNTYLYENKKLFKEYVEKEIPLLHIVPSHATYLLWVDVSRITDNAKDLCAFIRKETGLWITSGEVYGSNGKSFFRINLATQRKNVIDGMHRLKQGIELYLKK